MKNFFKSKNTTSFFLTIFIFFIVIFLININIFLITNKKVQNLYYYLNNWFINQKNIVVIEIDEKTLWGEKREDGTYIYKWLGRFPFDRSYYAQLIDNLKDSWAGVIALDIIFWEQSNDKSDDKLSNSIKNAKNVVACMWNDSDGKMLIPYYKFSDYTALNWYCRTVVNRANNITYSIYPFINIDWKYYEHFTTSILRTYFSFIYNDLSYLDSAIEEKWDSYYLRDKIQFLKSWNNRDDVMISFKSSEYFSKISFIDVLKWNYDKDLVKDKIVVVWATAKWIKDTFYTPIWIEYWVYTHVNFLNTVLSKSFIKYLDLKYEYIIIFCLIFLSVYFNLSRNSYLIILSNIWLFFILFILFFYFIKSNILLNYPIEIFISFIIWLTSSNIVKYINENKNKNKLNKALWEYVSKDIAEEVLSNSWKINFDWERKKIAIYFSDIEWFTTISEKFNPEKLVYFLRIYLSEMSDIIMDQKWFIDKYEWDAIMALWWTFINYDNYGYNACISALKQQKRLKELNYEWKKLWFSEIKVRIWLHIWEAIVWNIGSSWRKMEFTALWDNVNLASRLEWVNKEYGTYICVSEDVYKENNDNFEFRYLDKIKVKWKEKSINIYELLSLKWDLEKKELSNYISFNKAIDLYQNRDFESAKNIFEKLKNSWDKPSFTYYKRCEKFLQIPPKKEWDGVYTMLNK